MKIFYCLEAELGFFLPFTMQAWFPSHSAPLISRLRAEKAENALSSPECNVRAIIDGNSPILYGQVVNDCNDDKSTATGKRVRATNVNRKINGFESDGEALVPNYLISWCSVCVNGACRSTFCVRTLDGICVHERLLRKRSRSARVPKFFLRKIATINTPAVR